ncbi:lytic transglycosylase domain-containing protein [Nocardioides cavernaquae]|uniref:Lytic murein transglycosylase n=1 Tax=Nocardioides cavernaquae TaxID=2321396 RepID=A0A3A5HB44_9ACTN|nr:lytic murein transglycosylase [Nocardioides cavernaquae]RJS45304.1 lytic murein transglycosylase [Nocardioides cavernaquae]
MRVAVAAALLGGLGLLAVPVAFAGAVSDHDDVVSDPVLSTEVPVYAQAPQAFVPADPSAAVVSGRVDVDPRWVARSASGAGIPAPAVRAYARAELLLHQSSPSCHLAWTTLAGIGYIESRHGTIGSRSLGEDGRSSTPILGPALNGEGAFAAIPASAMSAQWHGDAAWDHAVGPLQFIPSTWARWTSDADGDGIGDPNDLDDAAYAAGRYLCADGHDLGSGAGWGAAIFSYNHSTEYVDSVFSAASAYADRTG